MTYETNVGTIQEVRAKGSKKTGQFTVTIPKGLALALGYKKGDRVDFQLGSAGRGISTLIILKRTR